MIEYIICENNLNVLNDLNNLVTKIMMRNNVEYSIKLFEDYNDDFVQEISKNDKTKVYILDIETPTSSGFEMATKIREVDLNSYIIFYTGHDDLGSKALKLDVFFAAFIDKFDNAEERLKNIIEKTVLNAEGKNVIKISIKGTVLQLKIIDILYIHKNNFSRKTCIHTTNGNFEISKNLTSVMKLFDDRFIQTHRACFVNKQRVMEFNFKDNAIVFNNNTKINLLSAKYKKDMNLDVI